MSLYIGDICKKNLPKDLIISAIEGLSHEMPYSSVKFNTEDLRREYFLGYNSRLLLNLECHPSNASELYSFFKSHDRHWQLRPEVPALLHNLRSRNYQLVVASNFDSNLDVILRRHGIFEFFSELFVSAAMGVEKPSSEFYEQIPKLLPQEIVMVGDDLTLDVFPSLDANIHSIHIAEDKPVSEPKVQKNDYGRNYIQISDLLSLLQVLPFLTSQAQ